MFCYAAKKDGKVIGINEKGIIIEYVDGERKGVELGRRFGNDSGLTFAHEIIPNMIPGQEFKKGEIVAYNKGFFEPDVLNPKNVVWKVGTLVNTVLLESTQTHEDASSISRSLASQLSTKVTKVKTVKVEFDKEVRNIVTPGTVVEYETILCIIEGAVTSNANLFDEESINSLRVLSSEAPTAKTKGVVEKIEVLYNGDKEDMSNTLRAIANNSDKTLKFVANSTGKSVVTGLVDEGFRIDNEPLGFETMAIRFYITTDVVAGVGDKGVFGNQLKTVFSEVMDYEMRSENGTVIDAVFGAKSIQNRIVHSPAIIGTTNVLLELIGKKASDIYHKRISK